MHSDLKDPLIPVPGELENFEEIVKHLIPQPGEIPRIDGIDIHGGTLAFNGQAGGDHLIFVDFNQRFDLEGRIQRGADEGRLDVVENLRRCRRTAGIAVLDVSGIGSPTRSWRRCSIRPFSSARSTNWTCVGR